jgi:hypothetical protein
LQFSPIVGLQVRVGMEATEYTSRFQRLLAELDFEVWIGDPAVIEQTRPKNTSAGSFFFWPLEPELGSNTPC